MKIKLGHGFAGISDFLLLHKSYASLALDTTKAKRPPKDNGSEKQIPHPHPRKIALSEMTPRGTSLRMTTRRHAQPGVAVPPKSGARLLVVFDEREDVEAGKLRAAVEEIKLSNGPRHRRTVSR